MITLFNHAYYYLKCCVYYMSEEGHTHNIYFVFSF